MTINNNIKARFVWEIKTASMMMADVMHIIINVKFYSEDMARNLSKSWQPTIRHRIYELWKPPTCLARRLFYFARRPLLLHAKSFFLFFMKILWKCLDEFCQTLWIGKDPFLLKNLWVWSYISCSYIIQYIFCIGSKSQAKMSSDYLTT